MTRIRILGALLATATVAGGCSLGGGDSDKAGGEEQPDAVVLTLANPGQREDVDEFVRAVADQSNGSIRIEVEEGWRAGEVGFEQGTIEDVRDGKADMGSVGVRAFDLFGVKSFQPVVAPFAVDSYELEREVLSSSLSAEMLAGVEDIDLAGIALLAGELRKPVGLSRPLVDAADYRGATIGIRPSKLSSQTFAALGARTQGYPLETAIPSLDGLEAHLAGFEGSPYADAARTASVNVNLWPRPLAIVMNPDAYEALSEEQREVLREAGRRSIDPAIDDIEKREQQIMGILCTRDTVVLRTATQSQLDGLRAGTDEISERLRSDEATRSTVDEIEAMRAQVEPEPAPACADDGDDESVTASTPLDDTLWGVETTKEEAAELVPAQDLIPENWGESTLAFRQGRFAFTTDNGGVCIWAAGTYSVEGDTVEWTIEDAGGEGEVNSPGEVFRFGWSVYRDQLTLKAEQGQISPEPFRVKPWRLLDDEPSVDALSHRCRPPADALG